MSTKFGLLLCIVLASFTFAQEPPRENKFFRPKPNPNSSSDLFELLKDPDIAMELGIDPTLMEQISRKTESSLINQIASANAAPTKEEKVALAKDYFKKYHGEVTETLDELLSPDKVLRLRQIAHRIEIGRIGFSAALSDGWFGDNVKLKNPEREEIVAKISAIDAELKQKIRELNVAAEIRVLALLPPQARKEATRLLGEPFDGRHKSSLEIASQMHKIKTNTKLQERVENPTDK